MVQNLDVQFHSILELIAFAFKVFKSIRQNFGLIQALSNFGNFRLGNGERLKSQCRSYLIGSG
jgi:hypothetical protein